MKYNCSICGKIIKEKESEFSKRLYWGFPEENRMCKCIIEEQNKLKESLINEIQISSRGKKPKKSL